MKKAHLWIAMIGCCAALASADPFVGTRDVTLYSNDNIVEGVTMTPESITLDVSTTNGSIYEVSISDTESSLSYSMVRNDDQLSLTPQPKDMGGWTICNSYIVSDGGNGAYLLMGQDGPSDIGISVASWTDAVSPLSVQDIVGDFELHLIEDWNLLDAPLDPFMNTTMFGSISDAGNGQVNLDYGGSQPLLMDFDGIALTPAESVDAIYEHFVIYTNGERFVWTMVAAELNDPTDVSASIGLGWTVPEPASALPAGSRRIAAPQTKVINKIQFKEKAK